MGKNRSGKVEPSGFYVEKRHWRGRLLNVTELGRINKILAAIPGLRSFAVERLVITTTQTDERVNLVPRQHALKLYRILAVDSRTACKIADESKYLEELKLGHHRERNVNHLAPASKNSKAAA